MRFKICDLVKGSLDDYKAHGPINIALIGDSVTHGCLNAAEGNHYDTVYHNRLKMMINTVYPDIPVNIINSAVAGECAGYAVHNFDRDVKRYMPDLVIICYGLNDVNFELEDFKNNLREFFKRTNELGIDCIFMKPNMMCTEVDDSLVIPEERGYAEIVTVFQNEGRFDMFMEEADKVAAEFGITVCDCYSEWKKMAESGININKLLANGINHPTREMHKLFAEKLYETIFSEKFDEKSYASAIGGGLWRG